MSDPLITYRPRPDATPEGERVALARVYRIIIESGQKKAAGASGGGTDAKGVQCNPRQTKCTPTI